MRESTSSGVASSASHSAAFHVDLHDQAFAGIAVPRDLIGQGVEHVRVAGLPAFSHALVVKHELAGLAGGPSGIVAIVLMDGNAVARRDAAAPLVVGPDAV